MQSSVNPAHGLPLWAQALSLGIAVLLAVLRVYEFFALPSLYVKLTSDLFFRLIDAGEAIFCHAVLLARNGPVLISDIAIKLKRIGNKNKAEKLFPIRVMQFGEKVQGSGLVAEHHFYSSSALQYLAEDTPLRAVYLGVQREYQSAQQKEIQDFVGKVLQLKANYSNASLDPDTKDLVMADLAKIISEANHAMQHLIQLEQGDYELSMEVTYLAPGRRLWNKSMTSRASIRFKVDDLPLSNWKAQLANTLRISAVNQLTDQTNLVKYPEFQPTDFEESADSI